MHGGDIYRNHVEMDFSVSLNLLPVCESVREALISAVNHCMNYPDICNEGLNEALKNMLNVSGERILFGNGASEIFTAILHAIKPDKVLLLAPGYTGYERAIKAAGADILYYEMSEKDGFCINEAFIYALNEGIDLLFLTNPNNPTGICIDNKLLESILKRCMEKGITVVLDECFIEFTEDELHNSFVPRLDEFKNLIVVRAFTKFFSLAGVRIGYMLTANDDYIKSTALQLPEWNLSVFAQEAGVAAVKKKDYYKQALEMIVTEREYLSGGLRKMGIRVYPSEANFIMFYTNKDIKEKLLHKGIMIRDLSDVRGLSKGYYRIGIRGHLDNEKLLNAMMEIL